MGTTTTCAWTMRCMTEGRLLCTTATSEITSCGDVMVWNGERVRTVGACNLSAPRAAARWSCATPTEVVRKDGTFVAGSDDPALGSCMLLQRRVGSSVEDGGHPARRSPPTARWGEKLRRRRV